MEDPDRENHPGADLTGHETLVVPAKDRKRYEDGFLVRINAALKQAGKKAN